MTEDKVTKLKSEKTLARSNWKIKDRYRGKGKGGSAAYSRAEKSATFRNNIVFLLLFCH